MSLIYLFKKKTLMTTWCTTLLVAHAATYKNSEVQTQNDNFMQLNLLY